MKHPRRVVYLVFLAIGVVLLSAMALVLLVPSYKQVAKAQWHVLRCPSVPEQRTQWSAGEMEERHYKDPHGFGSGGDARSPNLHFDFDHELSAAAFQTTEAFKGTRAYRLPKGAWSPAIIRIKEDVSDSLVAVSAGCWLKSTDPAPDVRIIIRIDRADGSLVEWNEKRLRGKEHVPAEWERFNFEWLLRGVAVGEDDRISVFIENGSGADMLIDEMDIVFRSTHPMIREPHA
jgi:hypothetical protein